MYGNKWFKIIKKIILLFGFLFFISIYEYLNIIGYSFDGYYFKLFDDLFSSYFDEYLLICLYLFFWIIWLNLVGYIILSYEWEDYVVFYNFCWKWNNMIIFEIRI